ncbi:MAG: type 1 glutamine amidotransferase [bacterium]
MTLKDKHVAVLLEDLYEDTEFWYPFLRMKEEGATVTAIAPEVTTYHGKHGLPAKADMAIGDANVNDFDAVIIPGGYSPDHMRRHPKMVSFVKNMHDDGKIVAAICHAGWILASAGIVRGKNVTSFFSIRDDLVNAGAEWQDDEVVIDGNIITSRMPTDLPVFCRTIIGKLA